MLPKAPARQILIKYTTISHWLAVCVYVCVCVSVHTEACIFNMRDKINIHKMAARQSQNQRQQQSRQQLQVRVPQNAFNCNICNSLESNTVFDGPKAPFYILLIYPEKCKSFPIKKKLTFYFSLAYLRAGAEMRSIAIFRIFALVSLASLNPHPQRHPHPHPLIHQPAPIPLPIRHQLTIRLTNVAP